MEYGIRIDPKTGKESRYFRAEALGLDGKIDLSTRRITINDTLLGRPRLVVYEPSETQLLSKGDGTTSPLLHSIKKVFGCVVVGSEPSSK